MPKSLYLTIFLISSLLPVVVSAENIYVKSYTVESDETLVVPIYVNVSEDIMGIDVTLKFDSNVIVAQDVRLNNSYQCKAGCFWFKNVGENFVRVALVDTNGIKARDVPVIDVIFKVVGNPGDSTELKIDANMSDSNYNLIKPTTSNGFLTISGSPLTITVTATTTETTVVTPTTTTVTTVTATKTVTTATVKPNKTTPVVHVTTTQQIPTSQTTTTPTQQTAKVTTIVKNKTAEVKVTKRINGFNLSLCILSILVVLALRMRKS